MICIRSAGFRRLKQPKATEVLHNWSACSSTCYSVLDKDSEGLQQKLYRLIYINNPSVQRAAAEEMRAHSCGLIVPLPAVQPVNKEIKYTLGTGCLCQNCADLFKPASLNVLQQGNLWHCLIQITLRISSQLFPVRR